MRKVCDRRPKETNGVYSFFITVFSMAIQYSIQGSTRNCFGSVCGKRNIEANFYDNSKYPLVCVFQYKGERKKTVSSIWQYVCEFNMQLERERYA